MLYAEWHASMNNVPIQKDEVLSEKEQDNEVLRLEGLVVQTRLTLVETTRYLVIDFNAGSISLYRKPPPADDVYASQKLSHSLPSKILSSVTPSLVRSKSEKGTHSQFACDNLAHISRQQRHLAKGVWEPTFTVPSSVDWKLRDVKNDETGFCLILPIDFFLKHEADVGGTITQVDSWGSVTEDDDNDGNASVKSVLPSKRNRLFPSLYKSKLTEVVFHFRAIIDGNEKFIWLQAASEMGRLCSESAKTSVSLDVKKKLFGLPAGIGPAKNTSTAVRYAEWARLIDDKMNVSAFRFDVHGNGHMREQTQRDSVLYDSTRLLKVMPTYAYKNRRMTEKDLYREMESASKSWEDFRTEHNGDRDEEMIGNLHAEVLACHGLPKLDKMSKTDAVCYFVCGPFAFASDVIDGKINPVWPSKSRRACIFPLFHAYQKLFVGVFDDDGPGANDDFVGRVVIEISRLRPNSVYDLFIPLRFYQNVYVNNPRGVIHLRLRVEWNDERKVLLSYFRLPQKTDHLGRVVTVNCADLKAFRNVVLTVQGKDIPGRYDVLVKKGLMKEMNLYILVLKTTMKEKLLDIFKYVNPLTSLCVFFAWMHCVYMNSFAYVLVYFVAGIVVLLLRNYNKYAVDEKFNAGFTPITLSEIVQVLLWGGKGTNFIKPIAVSSLHQMTFDEAGTACESVFTVGGYKMDGDHMEFPFSDACRYSKKTLSESCVDTAAMFLESNNQVMSASRSIGSKIKISRSRSDEDNDEEEEGDAEGEEDEEQLLIGMKLSTDEMDLRQESEGGVAATSDSRQRDMNMVIPDKLWKRVKDPRGLPEQNAHITVKSRTALKDDIIRFKLKLHNFTMRLFDDRMFIVDKEDPEYSSGKAQALHQVIGTNKYNGPITAKIALYGAPGLESLKVLLSLFRAVFNLFTWRDPILTSIFFFGVVLLLCVLLVFPWRLFFCLVGFGAVGPQNWLVREHRKKKAKTVKSLDQQEGLLPENQDNQASKKQKRTKTAYFGQNFRFHNHTMTNKGIDMREATSLNKSTSSVHRAVVPTSPLISRRFYDWPPNPSLSKVSIYSE